MAKGLFNRYIWLVDTIYRTGKISLEDINAKWVRNSMSDGNPIPKKTFHNQRIAIEEMFDVNIECDKSTYEYYIDNAEDMERGGVRRWLLNTFAVNNLINESHKIKQRIQFEDIPSGLQYLTSIIEAMRDEVTLDITYQSYWMDEPTSFEVQPYFVKVFKQRWYLIGKSDKLRIYALDRMHDLSPTATKFRMPADFDPEAYFADCYGIIHDTDETTQLVKLKVNAGQANYLRALPLHHSQKEEERNENYSIFSMYLKPSFDFRQEILSLGEEVEVLQPECFRQEMKRVLEKVLEKYE
jgi:hypothetical protein